MRRALHFSPSALMLSDYAPFVACAFLIYVPFFFHVRSESFPVELVIGPLEHALFGAATIAVILFSAALGIHLGRRGGRGSLSAISPKWTAFLWAVTAVAFVISGVHLVISVGSFMEGDFVAAREAVELPGIGVLIRLPLVTIPLIIVGSGSRGKGIRFALVVLFGLDCARSFLMSERTALIEVACVFLVYARFTKLRIRFSVLLGAIGAMAILFALILQARLYVQSELGSSIQPGETTFLQSLAAYYADTTNKYYQTLNGSLRYPTTTALIPFESLSTGRQGIMYEYNEYLRMLEGFSPFIVSGLNNAGGLAEDISDFGIWGFLVLALRFATFGYLIALGERGFVAASLSVVTLIAVLEYPRFNYFNMPFSAYLAVIAILLGLLVQVSSRKRTASFYKLAKFDEIPSRRTNAK